MSLLDAINGIINNLVDSFVHNYVIASAAISNMFNDEHSVLYYLYRVIKTVPGLIVMMYNLYTAYKVIVDLYNRRRSRKKLYNMMSALTNNTTPKNEKKE